IPVAGAGAVKKPQPPTVASAAGGSGSGGSPEAATDDDYAAAAERWRSRMAGGPGGMGGQQAEHGSIGDGEAPTGGGRNGGGLRVPVVPPAHLQHHQEQLGERRAPRRPGRRGAVRDRPAGRGAQSGAPAQLG